jgi:hypothetical protein
MTDCMLSEERIEALANAIHDSYYSDTATGSTADIIRRFFAVPEGAVKVEVFVSVEADGEEYAEPNKTLDDDDVRYAKRDTHRCIATVWVRPVPPTPSVEG